MDTIERLISELRHEQARLDAAIAVIERLGAVVKSTAGHKRRGRPPKWLVQAKSRADAGILEQKGMEKPLTGPSGPRQGGPDRSSSCALPDVPHATK